LFFERHQGGERAILVHLDTQNPELSEDADEFRALAASAGAETLSFIQFSCQRPSPRFLIGSGKAEQLAQQVKDLQAELIIFNHALTPSQERNLESLCACRVIDRIGLILDIFAQRARTHEGKLQVELAQLEHLSTRLVRGWTHLERQKGGIGLRGPGETQLESDRRLLRERIRHIKQRLAKVRRQREQARRRRQRNEIPTVSLVGYTNAGKSSLFNALTQGQVYAADQLFATLDPTLRRLEIAGFGPIILVDTVGFIRHLPHRLVEAFRATLEESSNADLLLHVIDASGNEKEQQMEQVSAVLTEIGAAELPMLDVFNKIDLLESERSTPILQRNAHGCAERIWLSAQNGQGLEMLLEAIAERLGQAVFSGTLRLPGEAGRLRAKFFAQNAVRNETQDDDGSSLLSVQLPQLDLERLLRSEGLQPEPFLAQHELS